MKLGLNNMSSFLEAIPFTLNKTFTIIAKFRKGPPTWQHNLLELRLIFFIKERRRPRQLIHR